MIGPTGTKRNARAGSVMMMLGFVFLAPAILRAQDLARADLPREVADQVLTFFNDPATLRLSGESRIPSGRVITADVAVISGPLSLAGEIRGRVVVVNGDLVVEEGGRIVGDLLIIGGHLRGEFRDAVSGEVTVYSEQLQLRRSGGELAYAGPGSGDEPGLSGDLGVGSLRFTVRAGENYNRTEGLPVLFGPIFETGGRNPLKLEMLGTWRTDSGFNLDTNELGYLVRLDQAVGGTREYFVGGELFDQVQPLEMWGLTNLEASLATFLLHTDYRDYVDLRGWSGFARYSPRSSRLNLTADYRDERHEFRRVGSPWTLSNNDEDWRPQPMVYEGKLRSVGLKLDLDTRNDPRQPSGGWFVDGRLRFGVGGDWTYPAHLDPYRETGDTGAVTEVAAQKVSTAFATGFLDVRSFNRLTPSFTLNFRGLAGGSLRNQALPPQYQHTLGGEGSMPGYGLFWGDCNARDATVGKPVSGGSVPDPAFHQYGCDRIAMFQAELRQTFFTNLGVGGNGTGWMPVIDLTPGWALFTNVGRGWALSDTSPAGYERADTQNMWDAGLGVFLGSVGVYWATPLTENPGESNFFIRLALRF